MNNLIKRMRLSDFVKGELNNASTYKEVLNVLRRNKIEKSYKTNKWIKVGTIRFIFGKDKGLMNVVQEES
jgi:hypothetical protein